MKKTVYGSRDAVGVSKRNLLLFPFPSPAPIMRMMPTSLEGSHRSIIKKMLITMKLLSILLFVALTSSYAEGTAQRISLSGKQLTLKQVFAAIEQQTGYVVFANEEYLLRDKTHTLSVENIELTVLLDIVLKDQPVIYSFEGETIIISRKLKGKTTVQPAMIAPPVKVHVTDASGQPLVGATVAVKKSGKSGVTDALGNITVNVDAGDIVTITYVGYTTQEIKITEGRTSLQVVMNLKDDLNDEVIVLAYGQSKRKTEMVGSAVQLNADRIENLPASRLDALLEGQLPGIRVTFNTDDASSTKQRMNIRIRGQGSFTASNEPLWIIDGTPVYTGDRTNLIPGIQTAITPLSYLNPADVESVTVLKDAAAAAIYGANASNGVILVTTKSGGKYAKPQLSLALKNGISSIKKSTKFQTLDGAQYLELAKEAFKNSGKDLTTFPYNNNDLNNYSATNTDWLDAFYSNGIINDASLSLNGGKNKFNYNVSGGYYSDKSTIKGNTQNRASLSSNLKYKVNTKLNISLITRYSHNKNNTFNPGSDYLDFLPIFSPYNNDGSFRLYNKKTSGVDINGDPIFTTTKFFNSIAEREENDDIQKANLVNNNIKVEYEILPGLKSSTQYGIDYLEFKQNIYKARTNWSGMNSQSIPEGYANKSYNKTITKTFIEHLTYNKSFGDHKITGLAGIELNSRIYNTRGINGSTFEDDSHRTVDFAGIITSRDSSKRETKQASYFGQFEYSYNNRYFIQFTGRRDGSSTFGSDSRWGNFSSVGIGWNIKNDLLLFTDWLDYLRVDATYGNTGNSRLSNQESFGIYSFNSSNNYDDKPGAVLSNIPNKKLRWETAQQTNLKLNLGVLDRLTFLIEAYRKKTVQAIVSVPVSRTTGETSAQSNTGELLNEGLELTVGWDIIKNEAKQLNWSVELNGAHNRNKALKLYNENDRTNGLFIWREGYDVQTYFLIPWAGVDPRDGAPLWYDASGNLTRVYSINNRIPGKSANPDFFGGFRTNVSYKAFSFGAFFTYNIGGYQFSSFSRSINSDGLNLEADNQSINQLNRWQQPGDIALNPKPIWGTSTSSTMNSTRFLYKTTFMRLNNLVLGYTLPEHTVQRLGIKALRFNLIANELGFWTPYDKSSRNTYKNTHSENEIGLGNSVYDKSISNTFKQSRSGYPMESSYVLGINITF